MLTHRKMAAQDQHVECTYTFPFPQELVSSHCFFGRARAKIKLSPLSVSTLVVEWAIGHLLLDIAVGHFDFQNYFLPLPIKRSIILNCWTTMHYHLPHSFTPSSSLALSLPTHTLIPRRPDIKPTYISQTHHT